MKLICFLLLILTCISCNQKQKTALKKILSDDILVSQFFNININSDTTLITQGGCIINISKGSLESDSATVKLDIREALSVTDITLAGLTTESNRLALSSGGMIYFNAASGYKISIKKPLEVLIPTNSYNRNMKVYKGEKSENAKINWKDPEPLPKDSTTQKIDAGEIIFKGACASCHKIFEDFTGPALYGVTDRHTKKWLYDYTRDAVAMNQIERIITTDAGQFYIRDGYTFCLSNQYSTLMTRYPNLSDNDLNTIYGYIKSESDSRPDLKLKFGPTCCDSCEIYKRKIIDLNTKKENLINENDDLFTLERTVPLPSNANDTNGNVFIDPAPVTPYSKVTPRAAKAVYYTINISATGWYNLDILMKEFSACQPSELFVRVQDTYEIDLNVVLIIPKVKAFIEGGKLKDSEQYGFDEDNGKISLPQNAQSYLLAFGEFENKIIFGKKLFTTKLKQTIDIMVEETTKEKMMAEIKALNLDSVNASILTSKNAEQINEGNKSSIEIEKLKPKDCDCDVIIRRIPLQIWYN